MFPRFRRLHTPLLILLIASVAIAAELSRPVQTPVIPRLQPLARKSGYIFSGRVKSVEPIAPSAADGVSVMRVTFQVEQGFRGVRSGQELVIHEFAGLWQTGESYRPGQKVLLFLYPPSKLGLTSPVGGMSGRFAVDPGGRIIINPGRSGIGPLRPPPRRRIPKPTFLRPEDFARALRAALQE
jgi:hypothetical protein